MTIDHNTIANVSQNNKQIRNAFFPRTCFVLCTFSHCKPETADVLNGGVRKRDAWLNAYVAQQQKHIRDLKQRRFWATHINRKWTFRQRHGMLREKGFTSGLCTSVKNAFAKAPYDPFYLL